MVNKYRRKTLRQNWDPEDMKRAIAAVKCEEMGWLAASKQFDVPQATLRRRAQNKNKIVKGVDKGLGRFAPVLTDSMEADLANHILLLESRLFGLTTYELRKLAFEIAEANHVNHSFNREKKIAGNDWLLGFRKRHGEISLRSPEATSAARAQAFNKPKVQNYFAVLEKAIAENHITQANIYNVDESGLNTVQKLSKVFAAKGRKQVGAATSAERGIHCTAVCCMSAAGHYVPPAVIYPRKRWKSELGDGSPLGTPHLCQENGWMTAELFKKWLEHFVSFVRPSQENKVLLLLDGHSSHKSYEAVTYARQHGVVMMCFPAHCTHRLQPLDVSFFGPLKGYFYQDATRWMKNHPGRLITQFQISTLFGPAYRRAATAEVACSGFRTTGIVPFNPDVFPDWMFAPAATTDQPQPASSHVSPDSSLR